LQADGVDEKNQSKFAHKLQDRIVEVKSEVTETNPGKQHAGDPQANALELDTTERKPADRDASQDYDCLWDRWFEKKVC